MSEITAAQTDVIRDLRTKLAEALVVCLSHRDPLVIENACDAIGHVDVLCTDMDPLIDALRICLNECHESVKMIVWSRLDTILQLRAMAAEGELDAIWEKTQALMRSRGEDPSEIERDADEAVAFARARAMIDAELEEHRWPGILQYHGVQPPSEAERATAAKVLAECLKVYPDAESQYILSEGGIAVLPNGWSKWHDDDIALALLVRHEREAHYEDPVRVAVWRDYDGMTWWLNDSEDPCEALKLAGAQPESD